MLSSFFSITDLDSNNRNLFNKKNEKETPNISLRKHFNSINRRISYANKSNGKSSNRIKRTVTNISRENNEATENDGNIDEDEDVEFTFEDIQNYDVKNNVNNTDESAFNYFINVEKNVDVGNNNNNDDLIITNEFDQAQSNNEKLNLDEENQINPANRNNVDTSNFIESVFGQTNQYFDEDVGNDREKRHIKAAESRNVDEFIVDEPIALPLRPIIRGPFDEEEQSKEEVQIVYVEPHSPIKLNCEVDLDITTSVWMKDGQVSCEKLCDKKHITVRIFFLSYVITIT